MKTSTNTKAILGMLAAAALIIGGYFILRPKSDNENTKEGDDDLQKETDKINATKPTTPTPPYIPAPKTDVFPLKKGSKGINVGKLQSYLIKKYGKSVLPKYGADNDFGSETEAACINKLGTSAVSEIKFNSLMTEKSFVPTQIYTNKANVPMYVWNPTKREYDRKIIAEKNTYIAPFWKTSGSLVMFKTGTNNNLDGYIFYSNAMLK